MRKLITITFAVLFVLMQMGLCSADVSLNPFSDKKIFVPTPTEDTHDFIKDGFNAEYGSIRISKTFFWFETDKIAEYSLITNTNKCYIDCSANGKAVLYFNGTLFDDITFDTLDTNERVSVNSKYYIKVKEIYQIDVPATYKEVCNKNKTTECWNETATLKKENRTREVWIEYRGEELAAGNYEWRIEGKKDPDLSVDWKVTKDGKLFSEWEGWTTADCYGAGGTITIDGDYCVHTFLTNGTFNISKARTDASLLLVAGGGGGASGGGGAGGVLFINQNLSLETGTNYAVIVGAGGLKGLAQNTAGGKGKNTTFGTSAEAIGGGGGIPEEAAGTTANGGSGGGGTYQKSGGYGNTTQTNNTGGIGYGKMGGLGYGAGGLGLVATSGGGGAGASGGNGTTGVAGNGGNGLNFTINGSNSYFAGGGAGGGDNRGGGTAGGTGGLGGGGNGGGLGTTPTAGINGTGGGGGAAYCDASGCYATDSREGGSGIAIVRYKLEALPVLRISATFNYPANDTNYSTFPIVFSGNATAIDGNTTNISMYIWNSSHYLIKSNISFASNSTSWSIGNLPDGTFKWMIGACASNATTTLCNSTMDNRTIRVDTTPDIQFVAPTENSGVIISTAIVKINVTATGANGINNITIKIDNQEATTSSSPNYHEFTLADGYYTYNATSCNIYNHCNNTATRNITVDTTKPSITLVHPTGATYANKNVSLNYTARDATLQACWYSLNGAANVTLDNCINASVILAGGNNSLIMYANDSVGNVNNSDMVYPYYFPELGLCTATNNVAYVNFTFKNETIAAESVTGSVIASIVYYFDTGITKTLSFTNMTENPSYSFCIDGQGKTLHTTTNINYDNSESYPRNYNENISYTNITANKTLYLLPINSGHYVTFSVVDNIGQAVPQASINISLISGENIVQTLTDDMGITVAFLNPLTAYKIVASKTGLTTSSQTYAPVLTAYTIILGGAIPSSTNTTMPVNGEGIITSIAPTQNSLDNGTTYSFNFTIIANLSNLDNYGFTITNGSFTLASVTGNNPNGEALTTSLNTGQNKTFIMRYWYEIDGDYSNYSKVWVIYDSSGSGWSILNFFTDMNTYSNAGIFGLTSFGLTIIIFLIIFVTTGIMAYQFSLSSPAMVSGIIFLQVLFFDVILGMIPNPADAIIQHFPTIFIGLIMVGLFLKEVTE